MLRGHMGINKPLVQDRPAPICEHEVGPVPTLVVRTVHPPAAMLISTLHTEALYIPFPKR